MKAVRRDSIPTRLGSCARPNAAPLPRPWWMPMPLSGSPRKVVLRRTCCAEWRRILSSLPWPTPIRRSLIRKQLRPGPMPSLPPAGQTTRINEEMMLAATRTLADLAKQDVPDSVCKIYGLDDLRFGPNYIIPKPFDPRVVVRVAEAVVAAAMQSGVARVDVDLEDYRHGLEKRLGGDPGVTRLLIQKARARPCRIVFPEGENPTVLRACRVLVDEEIANPVLLGNAQKIRERATGLHLDLGALEIIDVETHPRLSFYADELFRLRQRKGVTRTEAAGLVRSCNTLGALMVQLGDADALVTGLTTHYPDTIRPLLQIIPLRPEVRRVSGLYLTITPRGKLYFLADCTVNIQPSSEDLAEVAICAATAG